MKISYIYYWPDARTLPWCYNRHVKILLWLLFCLNISLFHCYRRINVFLRGAPLHSWVNPAHFKGAHVDPDETYMMKSTWKLGLLTGTLYLDDENKVILSHNWDIHVPWNIHEWYQMLIVRCPQYLILVFRLSVLIFLWDINMDLAVDNVVRFL